MTRNVMNAAEVEAFIADLEGLSTHDPIRCWLRTVFRNWVIRLYPIADRVQVAERRHGNGFRDGDLVVVDWQTLDMRRFKEASPPWLRGALERGEDVRIVRCDDALTELAWKLIEWLESLAGTPKFARLNRMSVAQAIEGTNAWLQSRIDEDIEESVGDVETVERFDDGYRLVRLKTPHALAREGDRMNSCIGGYGATLARPAVELLSLRDPQNRPVCTIHTDNRMLVEVRGHGNAAAAPKYRSYIEAYVRSRGIRIFREPDAIEWTDINQGHYPDINDFVADLAFLTDLQRKLGHPPALRWTDELAHAVRRMIWNRDEMSDRSRETLFDIFARPRGQEIQFEHRRGLDLIGVRFDVVEIDFPFVLYFLRRARIFRSRAQLDAAEGIVNAAIGGLLDTLERRHDWFVAIEGREKPGPNSPRKSDALSVTRFEYRHIRHRRLEAKQRAIAELRRERRGLLNDFTVPWETRERWHEDLAAARTMLTEERLQYI